MRAETARHVDRANVSCGTSAYYPAMANENYTGPQDVLHTEYKKVKWEHSKGIYSTWLYICLQCTHKCLCGIQIWHYPHRSNVLPPTNTITNNNITGCHQKGQTRQILSVTDHTHTYSAIWTDTEACNWFTQQHNRNLNATNHLLSVILTLTD